MTRKKSHLAPENQHRLDQLKTEAHARILKRDFVQFRVDSQMMDLLLKVANHKREPLGVMLRQWVEGKLAEEVKLLPLPAVKLARGTLSEKSSQQDIEKAVLDYQSGRIQLSDKEYRALMDWLLDRHLAAKYARSA